ncbi:hypothetical protein EVAR_5923_1 [Eumeta japonica]|uniref:Uncharacterized protein n=1 Tax=Eumeta variegata TaxID=151549 RepID=A0A4C1TF70_EUMVA|nr:hypothetical protein EVAR_5923_1 [Eumeta japonica]
MKADDMKRDVDDDAVALMRRPRAPTVTEQLQISCRERERIHRAGDGPRRASRIGSRDPTAAIGPARRCTSTRLRSPLLHRPLTAAASELHRPRPLPRPGGGRDASVGTEIKDGRTIG